MSDQASEKSVWLSYYGSQISAQEQLSKDYAHLAVQSLIGMNAGALLAIPPVVEVFFSNALNFGEAIWPMAVFLLGLLLAIGCAYMAYFNYQYGAMSLRFELFKQLIHIDEKFDTTTFHQQRASRSTTRIDYDREEKRYDKLVGVMFYVANGLGVASLASFVVGAFWFAFIAMTGS
jgi:hypothetical protein